MIAACNLAYAVGSRLVVPDSLGGMTVALILSLA